MREDWRTVKLESVFQLSNKKLGAHATEPPVFAVSKYDGVVLASEFFEKRIASSSLDGYKLVDSNDWVYSTIHIDEGSISRNHFSYAGVVSPMYTTMRWTGSDHLASYFELLLKSDLAIRAYRDSAQGTVNRRRSLSWGTFSKLEFVVPSTREQKRIVDLMSSVDSYIAALQQQAAAARVARSAVLSELLSAGGEDWTETSVSSLLTRSIGGVWGTEPGTDQEEVTVVRSTEFTKSGVLNFVTGVPRSIKSSQLSTRELAEGDILLEKSGGGPEQPVGRVVYVQSDIPPRFVCSNFIQLLTPSQEKVVPRFLFLVMWLWHFENKTLEYQAQTTGIRNLRTPDYLEQSIALPPLAEQRRIVEIVSSIDEVIQSADSAIADARSLRSGLLSDLLSGAHEIPESYDRLLGAA